MRASAASHGWSLDGIDVLEIAAGDGDSSPTSRTPCSTPPRSSSARRPRPVLAEASGRSRRGVVFDSLSELRLLAQNPLRYRRQILALKQYFLGSECTVLFCSTTRRGDARRHAAAQHRPRRDEPGAALARVRRRAAAAPRHASCAAGRSAAATTTSSSGAAGSRSSPGSSPPSTTARTPASR